MGWVLNGVDLNGVGLMADHLGLQVEPSKESFTFVDCSQRSSGGVVRDLEVQIGNALFQVDFHVLDIKLNRNSSLLLGRAFLSTVGAVCNLKTNQLCLTLIDPYVHYNPIPVKKPQTPTRRINDPRLIAACHCGAEYETEYSASIETHTATSIDSIQKKSIDVPKKESVDNSPEDWENDYYNPVMAVNNATPEIHDDLFDEEYGRKGIFVYKFCPLNTSRNRFTSCRSLWERNSLQSNKDPDGYARAIDGHALQVSREDIADILQMANGADNLFMQQRTVPAHQKFYWEENDEYGVYRDDQGCARDVDGNIINVSKDDIKKLMERASRDEHSYICLPEHASSFTHTKLVP
ncbi:hypothetical protein F2Q68_00039314 [Brassica cretica]|uniref:Uncharacterized protein n=1 Tax=Brassica cretica TaxID=69181 RepID=A0A8S9MJQ3_BRACR|nr:hypothetical protein F2Q68_00039314 [Brassica cretica]